MKIEINSNKGKASLEVPDREVKKTTEKIAGYLQKQLGLKKAKDLVKPRLNTPSK
jgi:ribosomal protein S17E